MDEKLAVEMCEAVLRNARTNFIRTVAENKKEVAATIIMPWLYCAVRWQDRVAVIKASPTGYVKMVLDIHTDKKEELEKIADMIKSVGV